jgi:hypothetical protein
LKRGLLAVALLLAGSGLVVSAYSYDNLQGQTNLFTMGGIILGGEANQTYSVTVNLDGKYGAIVSGYVGSTGCCVEFALLDNASFSKWIADPSRNPGLPIVRLDSSVVTSQTTQGEFSFIVASNRELVLVFANGNFPHAADFKVHADLDLRYLSLDALYGIIAGAVLMALAAVIAILSMRKRS